MGFASDTFPPRRKPVLIVLHGEDSTPGRIGRLLGELGAPLDLRRPCLGEPLPKNMSGHSGAVFFGGAMSVNDEADWLRREIDWIGAPLRENKPFLGICLGAQLLARHLGHKVAGHPEGRVEVGYYPIHPTKAGHDLCEHPFPTRVYQWHREGFDRPNGAQLLAEGEDFEAQAIRVGDKAFGLQFHPDVTYAMMCKWTVTSLERMNDPGAQARQRHLEGWFQHDGAVARWTSAFLRHWLGPEDVEGPGLAPAE
ncbi:glutamine amidotransferase [uncultured Rhodoblastus sp.]|uniref:glutamine amidotransferase n=1 Tax=uncultured Rhodoblastus sp. TaxID=543037 RepID=UPI0025EF046B|nr:glutamine amidotransferase [uncultured Rhodoblastus sp.]